jgi:hypothetical protein
VSDIAISSSPAATLSPARSATRRWRRNAAADGNGTADGSASAQGDQFKINKHIQWREKASRQKRSLMRFSAEAVHSFRTTLRLAALVRGSKA